MAEALWAFALDVYARPGVSAACIALQDESGADVDIVLYALWCASRGSVLDGAALEAADAVAAPWREATIRPVREVRRALKPPPGPPFDAARAESLRKALLEVELGLERMELGALEAGAPPPAKADPREAARHNLAQYARMLGVPGDAAPWRTLLEAFG
jgi:uncharacterized protein (TIGR02444 family)